MALDIIQHWQSADLGIRIAVLSSVAMAYVAFELVLAGTRQRHSSRAR